jgi:methyl-accepting chemotaxis protein
MSGIAAAARSTDKSWVSLKDKLDEIKSVSSHIAAAVDEQTRATHEIGRNVQSASTQSETVARAVEAFASTARQSETLCIELSKCVLSMLSG